MLHPWRCWGRRHNKSPMISWCENGDCLLLGVSAAPETALKSALRADKGTADSLNNHVTETHRLTRPLWSAAEHSGSSCDDFLPSTSFTALWVPSRCRCMWGGTKTTARCCWREDYPWCVHCPCPGQNQTQRSVNNIPCDSIGVDWK